MNAAEICGNLYFRTQQLEGVCRQLAQEKAELEDRLRPWGLLDRGALAGKLAESAADENDDVDPNDSAEKAYRARIVGRLLEALDRELPKAPERAPLPEYAAVEEEKV